MEIEIKSPSLEVSIEGKSEVNIGFETEKIYPELEDLFIVPTNEVQTFKSAKYGFNEVTVESIPNEDGESIVPKGEVQINKNGVHDVTEYEKANVEVIPKLQEKGVAPTKEFQSIIADEGYEGLSKVDIFPITEEYIIPEGEQEITQNGVFNVREYEKVNVNVKTEVAPKLQDKFVIPTKEFQSIVPDEGYDGLSNVDIVPIPDEYIIPTGELIIYESGEYDVKEKEKVIVRTVTPSGTLNITENGIHHVSEYEFVNVNTGTEIDGLLDGNITNLYNNSVTEIRAYACYYIKNLITVDLPEVISIGMNAFGNCTNLINVSLPKLSYFSSTNVFNGCSSLTKLDFPKLSKIQSASFNNCTSLTTVVLRNPSVCTLVNVNAFNNTPIAKGTGYIYVPDNLVDTYKTTTNWTTYADQIKPISELEVA